MGTMVHYGTAYDLYGVYEFDEYFQMVFLLEEGGAWLPCKVDLGRRRIIYVRENIKLIIIKNNVVEIETVSFPGKSETSEESEPYIKLADVFKKKGITCWTSNDAYKHIQSYRGFPAWEKALNRSGAYFSENGFAVQDYYSRDGYCTCAFNMIFLKKNWLKISSTDISIISYHGQDEVMYKSAELINKALGQSYDIPKETFVEQVRNCGLDADQIELYERDPRYEGTDKCWWCLS